MVIRDVTLPQVYMGYCGNLQCHSADSKVQNIPYLKELHALIMFKRADDAKLKVDKNTIMPNCEECQ